MNTSAQVLVIFVKTTQLHVMIILNSWIIMEIMMSMGGQRTIVLLLVTATAASHNSVKTLPVLTCVEE